MTRPSNLEPIKPETILLKINKEEDQGEEEKVWPEVEEVHQEEETMIMPEKDKPASDNIFLFNQPLLF